MDNIVLPPAVLWAALIQVVIPDEFFLPFGKNPLLQMLVAVPMYICSTGSIPAAPARPMTFARPSRKPDIRLRVMRNFALINRNLMGQ